MSHRSAACSLLLLALGCSSAPVVPTPREALVVSADVEHTEGTFLGAGGLKLFEQSWKPKGPSRGVLVVVHGLKDHSTRYAGLAEQFTRQGIAVYAFDLRGHGRSEGERVWVEGFDEYLDDLDTFIKSVRAREPGKPLFLFGHSMGGAISTLYTLTRKPDLQGLMLTGPALQVGSGVSAGLIRITKILSTLTPHLGVLELDETAFSRDPAAMKDMKTDPLISQEKGPARTAASLLGAIAEIQEHMEDLTVPVLAMHGTADRLTNPEGSKALIARAKSTDKTLKLYDGWFHDLLHEPDRAQVASEMTTWLSARLPPPG